MEIAKISSKGRITIPKTIREAAHLEAGDLVAIEMANDRIMLRKVNPLSGDYLICVQGFMDEWNSPEDEDAWRDL